MDMAYSNAAVFKHGLDNFVHAMVTNRAGEVSAFIKILIFIYLVGDFTGVALNH